MYYPKHGHSEHYRYQLHDRQTIHNHDRDYNHLEVDRNYQSRILHQALERLHQTQSVFGCYLQGYLGKARANVRLLSCGILHLEIQVLQYLLDCLHLGQRFPILAYQYAVLGFRHRRAPIQDRYHQILLQ